MSLRAEFLKLEESKERILQKQMRLRDRKSRLFRKAAVMFSDKIEKILGLSILDIEMLLGAVALVQRENRLNEAKREGKLLLDSDAEETSSSEPVIVDKDLSHAVNG